MTNFGVTIVTKRNIRTEMLNFAFLEKLFFPVFFFFVVNRTKSNGHKI